MSHTPGGHPSLASLVWCAIVIVAPCKGAVYDDVSRLFDDKLGPNSSYKTTIRPLYNQSDAIRVNVTFSVIAIVEINAISQKFVLNGFLKLTWYDEMIAWDPVQYDDTSSICPEPKQIWRPRLILTTTVEERDLFEDNYSPLIVYNNGWVQWIPGDVFPSSCKLNLYKYPFDKQDCALIMVSTGWGSHQLNFYAPNDEVTIKDFDENGEWSIESASLVTSTGSTPYFWMHFKLKRRPGFFIVNIVIPIVLMSFLNILVFIIPVDSGEKISYGITVLLALTVFMSIVSEQLPRSSDPVPVVTIYLLVLTIISVCTVIVTIAIVYCHHREEKAEKHQKAVVGFKSIFHKFKLVNRAVETFSTVQVSPAMTERRFSNSKLSIPEADTDTSRNSCEKKTKESHDAILSVLDDFKAKNDKFSTGPPVGDAPEEHYVNSWKQIGKHIDFISFVVFTFIWISVTIGFLVEMSS